MIRIRILSTKAKRLPCLSIDCKQDNLGAEKICNSYELSLAIVQNKTEEVET